MLSGSSPERLVYFFHRLLQSLLTCLIIELVFDNLNLRVPIQIVQCFLAAEVVGVKIPLPFNLCDDLLDLGGLGWSANSVTRNIVIVLCVTAFVLLLDLLLQLLILKLRDSRHLLEISRLSCPLARWRLNSKLLACLTHILGQTSLSFLQLLFPVLSELLWTLIYEAWSLVRVCVWRRYGFTQRIKLHFHLLTFFAQVRSRRPV